MMMASSLCTTAAPHRGSGLRSSFLASIPPAIGGRTGASHGCSLLVVRAMIEPSEKSVEVMRKFSEQYARRSGTYFCADKGVTAVVIKGLADHKDSVGAPLCPCRHYDNKEAEEQNRQSHWRRSGKQHQSFSCRCDRFCLISKPQGPCWNRLRMKVMAELELSSWIGLVRALLR